MTVPATQIQLSTGLVTRRGPLPVADPTQPVPGLDPDFVWLIDYEPYASPAYDPRIYNLTTVFTNNGVPHPTYPLYNQYEISYTVQIKSHEELYQAVDDKEQDVLNSLITFDKKDKLFTDMLGILIALADGINLDDDEQAVLDDMIAKYSVRKIHKNRKKQLYDDISKDKPFDIDDGWV